MEEDEQDQVSEDIGEEVVDSKVVEEETETKPAKEKKSRKSVSKKKNSKKSKSSSPKKAKTTSTVKKVAAVIILLAVLAIVLYFAFRTLLPERTIATVNGERITAQELGQKYAQLPDQYKLFITQDAFLDQLINIKLLLQEAKKQGIVISDEGVELELNNIKQQAQSEEAFQQLLKDRNINLGDLKKQIKEQLIINELLNETVFSRVTVTEQKIKDYYNSHKSDFSAKPGEIRVSHILVATEEEAKSVLLQLQKATPFSDLANLKSIDTASAVNGGDLGFISKGQMVKEFEDAAFTLKVGQVSSIIQTQFGYHIIKRDPDNIPYSEAKETIKNTILSEISNNAIDIYINQLKSDAAITKKGEKVTTKIETFTKTEDPICKEDGKVIITLFSTSKNAASEWISDTFDSLAVDYKDKAILRHWQLDTGDDILTGLKEQGIPKEELEKFKRYNPESTVPTYVFGCKYVRAGNSYDKLDEEKSEFKRVIDQLTTI